MDQSCTSPPTSSNNAVLHQLQLNQEEETEEAQEYI